jgi:flagellar hook-length control protein FliK
VFAANAITTNGTAPVAAGSESAVPLAGVAVAIASRAQAGSSQFDIRLDPPELGRIDVRLGVDGSGQVTTHVTVDRADTLQLLQSQQPQLQQALEQAGLKTADNGLQFTLRDQSFAGQNGGSGGQQQAAAPAHLVIPESDSAPVDTAQIYARLRLGNGLDIKV